MRRASRIVLALGARRLSSIAMIAYRRIWTVAPATNHQRPAKPKRYVNRTEFLGSMSVVKSIMSAVPARDSQQSRGIAPRADNSCGDEAAFDTLFRCHEHICILKLRCYIWPHIGRTSSELTVDSCRYLRDTQVMRFIWSTEVSRNTMAMCCFESYSPSRQKRYQILKLNISGKSVALMAYDAHHKPDHMRHLEATAASRNQTLYK